MVYKEIENYAYQVSKNDILGGYSLCIARKNETKPLIEYKFKTKKLAMLGMKKAILDMQKPERFKLPCGHNNAGIINAYPFKTWVCFECGFKTDAIQQI
jgi:hypothetical protein